MAGSDQLKSAWNSASMTSANTTMPATRCVSTASMRSVQRGGGSVGRPHGLTHHAVHALVARADDLEIEVAAVG